MANAAQTAREFFTPAATWTRAALKRAISEAFDRSVTTGRAVEAKVLDTMRRHDHRAGHARRDQRGAGGPDRTGLWIQAGRSAVTPGAQASRRRSARPSS